MGRESPDASGGGGAGVRLHAPPGRAVSAAAKDRPPRPARRQAEGLSIFTRGDWSLFREASTPCQEAGVAGGLAPSLLGAEPGP